MELLTVNESARILRVQPETIYRWVTRGIIPSVRLGRLIRVERRELQNLLGGDLTSPFLVPMEMEKNQMPERKMLVRYQRPSVSSALTKSRARGPQKKVKSCRMEE